MKPSRDVAVLRVFLTQPIPVVAATIDGRPIEAQRLANARWGATYLAPPDDGFELRLSTQATGPLQVRAVAKSFGLEGITVPPRTAEVIPTSFGFDPVDAVHVGSTFTF